MATVVVVFEGLLLTHVLETRGSYGAGLLRFYQFCDHEGIGESARMPVNRFFLAAFVADAIGKSVRNWLHTRVTLGHKQTTHQMELYQELFAGCVLVLKLSPLADVLSTLHKLFWFPVVSFSTPLPFANTATTSTQGLVVPLLSSLMAVAAKCTPELGESYSASIVDLVKAN
ncbi:hypothetical protein GGX14DRAFT_574091 [Mycena pura]|uniref:Uncharacterized protein n=1 Tax=Mycena pura TaxID=153505 RepID=A0AAD6V242_9AGAR|nr:hypothetical protein GGX14DRAFT_574091 [Mycena pura]